MTAHGRGHRVPAAYTAFSHQRRQRVQTVFGSTGPNARRIISVI